MLTRFVFWTGVVFETPLVLMGLGWMGLVTARKLIKAWRWAIIGSFVIAAFITPSIDPVTQAFVAVPLIFLYGLGDHPGEDRGEAGTGQDRYEDEAPDA